MLILVTLEIFKMEKADSLGSHPSDPLDKQPVVPALLLSAQEVMMLFSWLLTSVDLQGFPETLTVPRMGHFLGFTWHLVFQYP